MLVNIHFQKWSKVTVTDYDKTIFTKCTKFIFRLHGLHLDLQILREQLWKALSWPWVLALLKKEHSRLTLLRDRWEGGCIGLKRGILLNPALPL